MATKKKKKTAAGKGEAGASMQITERLRRHVELMGECAVWAHRAHLLHQEGQTEKAKRALVMAERFLKKAKTLVPENG